MSRTDETSWVESLRCTLQYPWRGMRLDKKQRRWCETIMGGRKEITFRFLRVNIKGPDMCGAKIRQAGDYLPRPFTVGRCDHLEYRSEIIEDG